MWTWEINHDSSSIADSTHLRNMSTSVHVVHAIVVCTQHQFRVKCLKRTWVRKGKCRYLAALFYDMQGLAGSFTTICTTQFAHISYCLPCVHSALYCICALRSMTFSNLTIFLPEVASRPDSRTVLGLVVGQFLFGGAFASFSAQWQGAQSRVYWDRI